MESTVYDCDRLRKLGRLQGELLTLYVEMIHWLAY